MRTVRDARLRYAFYRVDKSLAEAERKPAEQSFIDTRLCLRIFDMLRADWTTHAPWEGRTESTSGMWPKLVYLERLFKPQRAGGVGSSGVLSAIDTNLAQKKPDDESLDPVRGAKVQEGGLRSREKSQAARQGDR